MMTLPVAPSDVVESRKSVMSEVVSVVETYVLRSVLSLPAFLNRIEQGGQVKDDCGGSAYDVISFED